MGYTTFPHHIRNTQHFIEEAKSIQIQQGEIISSYNVKALVTSVPVDPSLNITHSKPQLDTTLPSRIHLSIPNSMSLLSLCLISTFFTFQGMYYNQVNGAAMGSPLSPVVANLFIEDFKTRALNSSPNPPRIWLMFVDDTFVID